MSPPNKKILIVAPAWIGDMVMAQTLFQLLRQQNPEAVIHVVAPAATYPVLQFMPEVDKAILFKAQHGKLDFWKRLKLGWQLQSEKYDEAILLTNSFKSAFIPFFAGIPKRTGWLGEQRFILLNDIRRLDKQQYPLMYQRFAALALPEGAKLPEINYPRLSVIARNAVTGIQFPPCQGRAREGLQDLTEETPSNSPLTGGEQKLHVELTSPILALCPGAEFGPAKRWPAEYYAKVAQEKIKEGWQVWLVGSPKESEAGDLIQEQTQNACTNFIGKTNLIEAIHLLSQVDSVICNDSGLMHIAAALDKPLVAIFGSSSPTHTPPLSHKAKIAYLELACSPCFKRECPLGHLNCLRQLTPISVLKMMA